MGAGDIGELVESIKKNNNWSKWKLKSL
jgi:hypothetical protein